ncbi:Tetratricopeptide repeat protein [Aquisphaera giovannonii]|uniref:Tetratricopeptide repeat protein n=1 Tax=Aquisphaera giovannonii TaxID=406548 RepID=A0A5B9W0U0_9BACT|nr:tetratricopeptide repeat protein [Aquisphaera giovannonii]QEH33575.1 Tetratricopeptide repeat protein [Aquisphaera giovannonii]
MSDRGGFRVVVAAISLVSILAGPGTPLARGGEDPRTATAFLQALRDRGLADLAIDYIDILRHDPACPPDLRASLDYVEGSTLIDEATRINDATRQQELLEQARARLEGFLKAQPGHALSRQARVQLARLLFERGRSTMLIAEEIQVPSQKAAKVDEARALYAKARDAYGEAVTVFGNALKAYPVSLPANDPRVAERNSLENDHLFATLKKGIAQYELAGTYPAGSAERASGLEAAMKDFHSLWEGHRSQLAGLAARMWEAKCFEEQGRIGEAVGIYKELLSHTDPQLRDLQSNISYFHIVALGKRKEYALAADEAVRWLEKYNRREETRSATRLGVLLELAKDLDAQLGANEDKAEKQAAAKRIVEAVSQVVRFATPYKNEALALLRKYKPSSAVKPEDLARISVDDAIAQAEEAMAARDWERAIAFYRAAIRKADARRDLDRINQARYNLSFCYYMNKQFYESDVLAEHLARRYPRNPLGPQAAELAMQDLVEAYNVHREIDRGSDLARLVGVARYAAETFSDREQGDDARLNLGQIELGQGKFDEAIADFSAVRERSPKKLEARTRLGGALWAKSRALDRAGEAKKAAAEATAAIDILAKTLQARQESQAPASDPGTLNNAADLAVALTETGKVKEALAMLAPIVKAQATRSGPAFSRLMEANLLAQIADNQVEPAIQSMKAIEQAGNSAGLTQLYLKLGMLFEKTMDQLRARQDRAGLERMQRAYRALLGTLAESRSGQSYQSLDWAGRGLLSLNAGEEAEKVYRRILSESVANPDFLSQAGSSDRLMLARVKLAAALRLQGTKEPKKLDEAASLVEEILSKNTKYLEPLVEKGNLLEAQAAAGQSDWNQAFRHWQDLAQKLGRSRPRPTSYFEAWYHAADCLRNQKDYTKARQTLNGVMRLNPGVGGPEMKKKYEDLLARLK